MSGIIDLPYLISVRGSGRIVDGTLIGVIVQEIKKPPIFDGIDLKNIDDKCVVIDLVGFVSSGRPSFVKGRVMAVIPANVLNTARKKNSGRMAVVLSSGSIRISGVDDESSIVSMSRWTRTNEGAWRIGAVTCTPLKKDVYPEFFKVIADAYRNNWQFNFPVQIHESYQVASEGYDFGLEGDVNQVSSQVAPSGYSASSATPTANTAPIAHVESKVLTGEASRQMGNLGQSSSSNIATLVQNKLATNNELKDKSFLRVKNRNKVEPASKRELNVAENVMYARKKVEAIIDKLGQYSSDDYDDSRFRGMMLYTGKQLVDSWSTTVGDTTGRALFKKAIYTLMSDFEGALDSTHKTQIDMLFDVKGTLLVQDWLSDSISDTATDVETIISSKQELVYVIILDHMLDLKGRLENVYTFITSKGGIDLQLLLQDNPYSLCYLDPSFSLSDLDRLAMYFNIDRTREVIKQARDVSYMHNYMLDASNKIISSNTVVPYGALVSSITTGYSLSLMRHNMLQLTGLTVKRDRIVALTYFLDPTLVASNFALPKDGWRKRGASFVLPDGRNPEKVVDNFIESGLGVNYLIDETRYISDYVLAEKELYIHRRLRRLASDKEMMTKVSESEIEVVIKQFCELKDNELGLPKGTFQLERQQAEALYQCNNPIVCLTGPAGSGKTTTAEALVFAVKSLHGVDENEIMFCAPTGKAARRLKETVKRQTRTIHSLFQVGGDSLRLAKPSEEKELKGISVLIVDESSMPNVNLMYDMLLRIPNSVRIFFLGDIEQLSPIGFGKPYANMMTYLPTVVLNVEKRASTTSGITLNSRKIIYESDGIVEDLREYNDFRILDTKSSADVVTYLERIISYHLGRSNPDGFAPITSLGTDLTPDDIQVISPINGKNWGVIALNTMLQEMYNPYSPVLPLVTHLRGTERKIQFRLGDRVIHTKKNQSERVRLKRMGRHSFILEESRGVNNGDVGKVVGFHKPSDLDFSYAESESQQETLRKEFRGTDNSCFLEVQYKDFSETTGEMIKYSILYRFLILSDTGIQLEATGSDIGNLELAYALTVDKMQGSESKLVLNIILPVHGDFLSRNRVYTAVTRAKEGQYLLGDVRGSRSAVNSARKIQQTERRLTLMDTF